MSSPEQTEAYRLDMMRLAQNTITGVAAIAEIASNRFSDLDDFAGEMRNSVMPLLSDTAVNSNLVSLDYVQQMRRFNGLPRTLATEQRSTRDTVFAQTELDKRFDTIIGAYARTGRVLPDLVEGAAMTATFGEAEDAFGNWISADTFFTDYVLQPYADACGYCLLRAGIKDFTESRHRNCKCVPIPLVQYEQSADFWNSNVLDAERAYRLVMDEGVEVDHLIVHMHNYSLSRWRGMIIDGVNADMRWRVRPVVTYAGEESETSRRYRVISEVTEEMYNRQREDGRYQGLAIDIGQWDRLADIGLSDEVIARYFGDSMPKYETLSQQAVRYVNGLQRLDRL